MIEMARRLDEAIKMDAGPDREAALRDLVRRNWRMWTILQAALLDPECTVPMEIRQNLLSLSNFIDKRSVECLSDLQPEKLSVLININRQIGAGLMGNPSDDPAESERLHKEAAQREAAAPSEPRSDEASAAAPEPERDKPRAVPAQDKASATTDTEA